MPDAADIIKILGLQPLEGEGGFFGETWRGSEIELPEPAPLAGQRRALGTAIFYLVTPESFSALHRLRSDEVFHFYAGDPCQMLLLYPDGRAEERVVGADVVAGMRPQVVVPAGVWQGTRLLDGGVWALLGTTMAPGFHPADFELAERDALLRAYPQHHALIAPFFAGAARGERRRRAVVE